MVKLVLTEIRKDYNDDKKIILILDNASYNHAYETINKSKELNIELLYLPTYSPNLNLIERLWKFFKKKILRNKYYQEFTEFLSATDNFFKDIINYDDDIGKLMNHKFEILKAD
jgi:transposase